MPDPPDELIVGGNEYDLEIRYLGPLAQLQRTLLKTKGTVDALSVIAQIMAMAEEVGWKFNWLEIAEEVAVAQGMPQRHIFSDEEVNATKQQVEAQRAALAQAEIAEKAGKATQSLSKRIEPGSALQQLLTAGPPPVGRGGA